MVKKLFLSGVVIMVLMATIAGITQNASAATLTTNSLQATKVIQGKGIGKGGGWAGSGAGSAGSGAYVQLPAPGELSQAEADALVYMVEEEKLARDVYNSLYATWGGATFQNIAAAEQTHINAVKNLLTVYGLEDPSSSQAGAFNNADLQALYDQLIVRGSQSLVEAYRVGGAIEEIDILDLQERLAQTDNADIQQVFNNLLKGSSNHLRAFVNALQMQTGEVYQPQFLSSEAYQALLGTAIGGYGNTGGGQGGNAAGGQGGGGWRGGRP